MSHQVDSLGFEPAYVNVPSSWSIVKAKWLFDEVKETGHPDKTLLSVTQDEGVIPREEREDRVWNPAGDVSHYKHVKEGQFVISLRSFEGGIEYSEMEGIVSPAYVVMDPEPIVETRSEYITYLFKSSSFVDALSAISTGIRQGKTISFGDFAEMPIPVPPVAEANAIAHYLNRKISRINRLITCKKRLTGLLEERRTAVITQAVTRGLDPDVPMKDSGVEWLGYIPESWEPRRIKTIGQVWPSNVDKKSRDDELSVRLCNYTDVYYSETISSRDGLMEATATPSELEKYRLRRDDVVITKDSESSDDIAVPTYINVDCEDLVCGYHLAIVRPQEAEVDGRFLYYCFRAANIEKQFHVAANGVTRHGLSVSDLGGGWIPVPPLREQEEIAEYLDSQSRKTITLEEKSETAISLLQEYRSALITSAVRGKIEVRDHVA